jgi:hypothetical protein
MESAEPIFQFSEALRIITDVTETSKTFLVNKHQCERLVNRLYAIGVKLRELPKKFPSSRSSDADNKVDDPAFDVLLTVLRTAKALLSKHTEPKASILSMFDRPMGQEAFRKMHVELDMLDSLFHIGDFEPTSESRRSAMLRRDAYMDMDKRRSLRLKRHASMDLEELSESSLELTRSDEGKRSAEKGSVTALESQPSPPSLHKLTRMLKRPVNKLTRMLQKTVFKHMVGSTESGSCMSIEEHIERSKSDWNRAVPKPIPGEDVDDEIESSKGHWSEQVEIDNRKLFMTLQSHPTWGDFFTIFGEDELAMGEKFAEGGQAELYEARVIWGNQFRREDMLKYGWESEWALKVFKKGIGLRDLQLQWPREFLECYAERKKPEWKKPRHVCNILCGTLLKDGRFSFLIQREQEDLRTVIERNMNLKTDLNHGPFPKEVAERIMYDVALGMYWLHSRNILHRDLKASDVLSNEDKDGNYQCLVSNFECSIGVVGTRFFMSPEVLQGIRNKIPLVNLEVSKATDVYGFGMTCYEVLTGKLPFEGHSIRDYDTVINGCRPELPEYVDDWARELLHKCWHSDPAQRPTFEEILNILLANSSAIRDKIVTEYNQPSRPQPSSRLVTLCAPSREIC